MTRKSLLEHPRLSAIELKLNKAKLDDAQRLLAELPDGPGADSARAYFATRILYERGRLDRQGVIERLRDLLHATPDFPEAQRMLQDAERGLLETLPHGRGSTTEPPSTEAGGTPSSLEAASEWHAIPKPPNVPTFQARLDAPSYTPHSERRAVAAPAPGERFDTELSPPPAPPGASGTDLPALVPTPDVPGVPALEQFVPLYAAPTEPPEPSSTIPSPEPPPPSSRSPSLTPQSRAPTLAEVANALARGEADQALWLAARAEPSAEMSLIKARALESLGHRERAEAELARLLHAPLLEPGLRAAVARFLLEQGQPERALAQAQHALEDDPKDPMVRVTCAWASIRTGQHTLNLALWDEADALLATVRLRDPAVSTLLLALRAWAAAHRGDATRALSLAQSALSQDARQPDALAAVAFGSMKLGLAADADRALSQLADVAPALAADVAVLVRRSGTSAPRAEPLPVATEAAIAALFGDAETALVHGRPELSVVGFERACADRLRALSRRGGASSWGALAAAAARLFTELPVLRHFAPFDCSLFSIARLSAAFDVLYGTHGTPGFGDEATVLLAGAYLGETVRQAFGAEWRGTPQDPQHAMVEGFGLSVRPCEQIAAALRDRVPLSVREPTVIHPGAEPLGNTVPLTLIPPSPWDPEPWPPLARVIEIGRALPRSVVGLYCARQGGSELDHSVASIAAIDRYVSLLAPVQAPPALDAGWARRAAVIVGAYLGEVLVQAVGARWQELESAPAAATYRLLLRDGSASTPVARAFDRLSGRRPSPLSEYVARIFRGRPSLHP